MKERAASPYPWPQITARWTPNVNSINVRCTVRQLLADTVTPVTAYLRIRDLFPGTMLLECADWKPGQRAFSFLCISPFAEIAVERGQIHERVHDDERVTDISDPHADVQAALRRFVQRLRVDAGSDVHALENGVFGYTSYDAVRYFEDIDLHQPHEHERAIPDLVYSAYRFVVAIDHAHNRFHVIRNEFAGDTASVPSIETMCYILQHSDYPIYGFEQRGERRSNTTDPGFAAIVERCKRHVMRGDVFQIVPSRRFEQDFIGDDFAVYRALRSVNPSPYLFYFDHGSFRIFGSSPEAQLVVRDGVAQLFPIAGTYRRTQDASQDAEAVARLQHDEKENAEHVMLVDLARNDLSRHCRDVRVESYKEVQSFSHVIHLTSRVAGRLQAGADALQLFFDTFPMGTLSGAPKHRAMQIIDEVEHGSRRAYAGAIGCFGFDGSCNHAIVIRSFMSIDQTLYFQAGAGVVADSLPASEVQEVYNKVAALDKALALAQEIVR